MLNLNVEKYMQIKFRNKGRSFSGCDCRGLVGLILREEFNIEMPDVDVSCGQVFQVDEAIKKLNDWKRIEEPIVPSVLLFCPDYPTVINHMGLCISKTDFIHINRGLSYPQIMEINNPFWKAVREGIYVP
jgi:murein DD-endopeptidase